MEQVRDGKPREGPDILKERDLSRALFGALKEKLAHTQTSVVNDETTPYRTNNDPPSADPETVMAEAACEMEDIIRRHAVVRWRENQDAQNRMRDDLDDFFVELQRAKGITLTWDQVDAIVDTVIAIAINRRDDV
jgi:type I restriction enzyme R subunit